MRVLNQNTTICSFKISLGNIQRLILAGLVALVFSCLAATGASAQASNVYITPDGGGNGVCTNNVHSPSWFNNSGNWGSGASQIGAGTIVHLCGTFGTNLTAQGGGQINNPITILFESGAKFSTPAFVGCYIVLDNQSNIVVDGGAGGIIENTANGSHLGNKVYTDAIRAIGSSNIEVKNLRIQNLYVHNDVADDTLDGSTFNCFLSTHPGGTISIHDNVMHDMNWCLKIGLFSNPGTVISIYRNEIYNMDHGLALFGDTFDQSYTLNFHDNWIHDFANWDTTSNSYHHDGIHMYTGDGVRTFYNNKFSGSMGHNNTSYVFEEIVQGGTKGSNPGSSQVWYNNVWIQAPNNNISNALAFITGNAAFYNNTFVCADSNGGDNQEGLRYNFGTGYYNSVPRHLTFENNVMSGCVTFLEGVNTILDGFNFNVYSAATAGGQHKWSFNSTPSDSLSAWQSSTGKEANSLYTNSSGLDGTGMPQPGSSALQAGTSLLNLGLNALARDIHGVVRPTSGAWTAGAFESASSVAAAPNPPSGLKATVN